MELDYTLEEIFITLDGTEYVFNGTINVEFYEEPRDRSTGYDGGAVVTGYSDLRGTLQNEDGDVVRVVKKDDADIFQLVTDAMNHDSIEIACNDWLKEG